MKCHKTRGNLKGTGFVFFQDGSYQLNIIPLFLYPAHFSSMALSFIHSWLISSCISFLCNIPSETSWRLSAALLWDASHRQGKEPGRCCTNRQRKVSNYLKNLNFWIKCYGSAYLSLFLVTLGRDFMGCFSKFLMLHMSCLVKLALTKGHHRQPLEPSSSISVGKFWFWPEGIPRDRLRGYNKVMFYIDFLKNVAESQETTKLAGDE